MHLKSITLKGFKSFPDRTSLEFGSGVSVIVGPNGSGKSNITDAVLWALGEQSPLAVRGQTMQDVIFAGAEGVKSRSGAEVEVVIDNSDGALRSEFSEISIARRLDRSGDGGYTLNGARCRLVDVIEVLSDSGLGKEMHSVISQGRVEAIIHSKPGDRTVLIEEAAGLSKHRKRRHRAQLKLARTQDNLARALDVEREARSRLRPLKRQAEAAELHSRLERQSLELRAELGQDMLATVRAELVEAESAAGEARRRRDELEAEQTDVGRKREQSERALAEHSRDRERLAGRAFAMRSACDRMAIRLESVRTAASAAHARLERSRRALAETAPDGLTAAGESRLPELEVALQRLELDRDERLASELRTVEDERAAAETRAAELDRAAAEKAGEIDQAHAAVDDARERRRAATARAEELISTRSALELERGAIVERQRIGTRGSERTLAARVEVAQGLEPALAAALGERLGAVLVDDVAEGATEVSRAPTEGGRALVREAAGGHLPSSPAPSGAMLLLHHVRFDAVDRAVVERLLANVWIVDHLDRLPSDFAGVAVTREGLCYNGASGEVRRLPVGAAPERALGDRSRRSQVQAELERIARELDGARSEAEAAARAVEGTELRVDELETSLRQLRRSREQALEEARRAAWLIEQRRERGGGPDEARRAELLAEISAERRLAETLEHERAARVERRQRLALSVERDSASLPAMERVASALATALEAAGERREAAERELEAGEAVGERSAAELRRLAQAEYDLQARLREASELHTEQEVRAAQVRDREQIAAAELADIAGRLGIEVPGEAALRPEDRTEREARLERLERRRERIGPVNPLAEQEYEEAIEHVEELERQRKDLEEALAELEALIRETDRRIRESFDETFAAAASNFEEVIQQLFPGGRGRLSLVRPQRPRAVLGDSVPDEQGEVAAESSGVDAEASEEGPADEAPGVEIEVTPAGKSTRKLSLLSGGEKSLVALGFLFAVFLARPCPFYILDEVEAALDDVNIDRCMSLVRRFSDRSQFIVITHQRRTMDAADVLYGVSMAKDGISRVVSRRLDREEAAGRDEERGVGEQLPAVA